MRVAVAGDSRATTAYDIAPRRETGEAMAAATGPLATDIDLHGRQRYRPTPDPSLSLSAPVLRRLLAYWRSKAAVRPSRRVDIDPVEIGADLGHVMLLDIEHDPLRFRWRLLGGDMVEAIGRNAMGKCFEEIYPHPLYADMMRLFSRVALTGLPIRHVGTARFVHRDHLSYESLHLPLFAEDGRVAMMFGGACFERLAASS